MQGPEKRRAADTSGLNTRDRARILVVEDQEDVRGLLVTVLEIEGHDVDEASNAHDGLERLQGRHYDLVLSDYAMPGGTGTWMLHEAETAGLLSDTAALIVTAHPNIRELSHLDVIPKPLDLDRFLGRVRRVLGESKRMRDGATDEAASTPGHRVEFVLYVSAHSPASAQARRNFEQLIGAFDTTQIKYSICDLGREPLAGDNDRVAFTPTLVKRYPSPRMWVLGTLRDADVIADILRDCGVDTKAQA